jgi:hypothetical protein
MRIYIKPPYMDKKVEDSSDDGDDIVDVYDDMKRRGCSHSETLYRATWSTFSRKAPAQRIKDQTHRGVSTRLGCPIYGAHHNVSLNHKETQRWYYSNLSNPLGANHGTALLYILHLFDCRAQEKPDNTVSILASILDSTTTQTWGTLPT